MFTSSDAYEVRATSSKAHGNKDRTRFVRRSTLQQAMDRAEVEPSLVPDRPMEPSLSTARETLDARTREWQASAKAVELTVRQLLSAENSRCEAQRTLDQAHEAMGRTSADLAAGLSNFDERSAGEKIEALFKLNAAAMAELERVTNDVAVAQAWCRSSWDAYSSALEREQSALDRMRASELAAQ